MKLFASMTLGIVGAIAWVAIGGGIMNSRGLITEQDFGPFMQLILTAPIPAVLGIFLGWRAGEPPEGVWWQRSWGISLAALLAMSVAAGFILPR